MSKGLHPNNPHNARYDFPKLIADSPALDQFVRENQYGDLSIDFSNQDAVMALNQAILFFQYKIKNWNLPQGHLCPPIPGRADYIHYLADLLGPGTKHGLDIGTGTSCIYPIIGSSALGWTFIATDTSKTALESCERIVQSNEKLKEKLELRLQEDSSNIFQGVINKTDRFDFSMCNPPFHSSLKEATMHSKRKSKNLNVNVKKKGHTPEKKKATSNFGGIGTELWCPGGEVKFISSMIKESARFQKQCTWFTTLVSKRENLKFLYAELKNNNVKSAKTIDMKQGQKQTRILAWSHL